MIQIIIGGLAILALIFIILRRRRSSTPSSLPTKTKAEVIKEISLKRDEEELKASDAQKTEKTEGKKKKKKKE